MKLWQFCAILFLLTCAKASWVLNLACDHCHPLTYSTEYSRCDMSETTTCDVRNVVAPVERDRLELNFGKRSANTVTTLKIDSKDDDSGFASIPTEIFEICPNLNVFYLSTALKNIAPTDWQNATILLQMILTEIQITELSAYAFNGLQKLEKLDLSWNKSSKISFTFRRIRKHSFTGMNNLMKLTLSSGSRGELTIEDGAFDLPKLTELDFFYSNLITLSDLTFSKLPNLEYLNLEFNQLRHLGQSLCCLPNIKYIYLNGNVFLYDIDLSEFAKLPRLEVLDLKATGFSFRASEKAKTVVNTSLKLKISY